MDMKGQDTDTVKVHLGKKLEIEREKMCCTCGVLHTTEAGVFASEKGRALDSEHRVGKTMSMSGFCLGYLHLDLSATGLASGPYPQDRDGKRKHIPSHIIHCDLQGPRATSVCDMSISCH